MDDRIEEMYVKLLRRQPSPDEMDHWKEWVELNSIEAMEEAILNSAEYAAGRVVSHIHQIPRRQEPPPKMSAIQEHTGSGGTEFFLIACLLFIAFMMVVVLWSGCLA